jgi:ABC-2 type transport system ATP-binding protein
MVGMMLEVSNVWKYYGRSAALKGVSFEVPKGGRALLLGSNGAGKSTMIKSIMGLYRFTGSVKVDGFDVLKEGRKARERIGYVPQNSAFYEKLTVEQEARLIATINGVSFDRALEKLEMVGLGKALRKPIGSLSGGMKQRFAISVALMTDPPCLIFDEPLASVDLRGQLGFIEFVRTLSTNGTTLLIATHLTGLSDLADQVIVLNRGEVAAVGTPAELLAKVNADDTFYIKPKAGMEKQILELVASASARAVNDKSMPLVVLVPHGSKVPLLKALFADGGLVEDISIDPSRIEASYRKLLQKTGGKAP